MSSTNPVLSASGLCRRFGGVVAADSVSLEVETGRVVGLIGPNGAGKSTLINLLTGFDTPSSGTITFRGTDLTGATPLAVRRAGIARTFQKATPLGGLTVLDNILVGMNRRFTTGLWRTVLRTPRARRDESEAVELAHGILDRFGLAADARTPAAELPFGKMRFLEVARAVADEPGIVLLDEPAAGLNEAESALLAEIIVGLRDTGTGVLLVDHDVPMVFGLCDEVVAIDFGKVIAHGTPSEVRRNRDVVESYLGTPDQAAYHSEVEV